MNSLPSTNEVLVIEVKHYAEAVIKIKYHPRGKTPHLWKIFTLVEKLHFHGKAPCSWKVH